MSTTVEVVDPIALNARLIDPCNKCCCCECDITSVPNFVNNVFGEELSGDDGHRIVAVTLGIFSIVRLERPVQLLVPACDFCIPEKECVGSTDDNPCDLFSKIKFPLDEFFPPELCAFKEDNHGCNCR